MEIVDYSERSFAVIGNTKLYKEQLKELGGKYNEKLKCGAGWIFSLSKKSKVEKLVGSLDIDSPKPAKIFSVVPQRVNIHASFDLGSFKTLIEPLSMSARMELLGRLIALCNTVPEEKSPPVKSPNDLLQDRRTNGLKSVLDIRPPQQANEEDYASASDDEEYIAPNRKRFL